MSEMTRARVTHQPDDYLVLLLFHSFLSNYRLWNSIQVSGGNFYGDY
jgi:hypothetical protein